MLLIWMLEEIEERTRMPDEPLPLVWVLEQVEAVHGLHVKVSNKD